MATFLLISAVNKYDSTFYGSGNDLHGCIKDAERMKVILTSLDREITLQELYDEDCIKSEVQSSLKWAAETMKEGDRFIWFHSGHGTYLNTDKGVSTGRCLHNTVFWDKEVIKYWKLFPKGAKIITLSDTCFSESNSRFAMDRPTGFGTDEYLKSRSLTLPREIKRVPTKGSIPTNVGVLSISACTAFQVSYENRDGGIFTQAISKSYMEYGALKTWSQFYNLISQATPEDYHQKPVLEFNPSKVGKSIVIDPVKL